MKTLLATLLTALALPLMAGEDEAPTKDWFAKGFEVRPFVAIETTDFDVIDRDAAGIGIAYYIVDNVGLEVEGMFYDTSNHVVDRFNGNILFRAPIGDNFAAVPFVGATRDIDAEDWGFHVGLRGEARVYKSLWASSGIRWQKVNSDDSATVDAGLSWKF